MNHFSRKFLILSFSIIIAATLMAGCTSFDNTAATTVPPATPVPVTLTTNPAVTESVTIPLPTTAVPESTPPVPENTTTVTPVSTPRVFLTYTNSTYGFSMDYPSDWQVLEAPVETGQDPGVPQGYSGKVDVVEFYSPGIIRCHRSECVNVQAEMHVEVDPAPPTSDLDEYYLHDIAAIQRNYPIDVSTHNSMFHIENLSAYEFDYQLKKDLINIHAERVYTGVTGKVFVFTFHAHAPYSGEEDQYAEYSGVADTMFKSFRPTTTLRTL